MRVINFSAGTVRHRGISDISELGTVRVKVLYRYRKSKAEVTLSSIDTFKGVSIHSDKIIMHWNE